MDIFLVILSAVIGYLLGSLSMSVLLSKTVYKGDVRNYGSHNAGATNMARVYGLLGGAATLVGDFLKAVVSMLIPLLFKVIYPDFSHVELAYALAGTGCFVGHAFPVFFGFKGGKGVTVGAAIALMTDWKAFLIILAVFILVFLISKIVSLSSISAAVAFIVTGVLFALFKVPSESVFFGSVPYTWYKAGLAAFVGLAVILLHKANIARLIKGEEKKFTYAKRKRAEDSAAGETIVTPSGEQSAEQTAERNAEQSAEQSVEQNSAEDKK